MEEGVLEIINTDQDIQPDFTFKIVMIGDSGVGKTSLVKYEIKNTFVINRDSTIIFEHSFKNFNILGKTVRLQIWDTCGQEVYHSSIKNFYSSALCVIVVFSLDSLDSFYKVNKWIEEIHSIDSDEPILILIGNKIDLSRPRVIDKEIINNYLINNNIENYYETSAKTGENVHEVFKNIVRKLFIQYAMQITNANNENINQNMISPMSNKYLNGNYHCCKSCFCINQ